jgi:hypothetical protein
VSVVAWDLLRYGPWVIESPVEFNFPGVDFSGGVLVLNAPDSCQVKNLTNVMIVAQDTDSKFIINGTYSNGVTFITKGVCGNILNSSTYQFKDSTIIVEQPIGSFVATTLGISSSIANLSQGTGASQFFGGLNIVAGVLADSQFGWSAPEYSRLPYTGNVPSSRSVNTLMSEGLLIAPQSISSSVPNYTVSPITVELSEGDHSGYESGLQGELRDIDDGSITIRKYICNGIGAWWFSQEDLQVDDTKSTLEEGFFNIHSGGSFLKRNSEQTSALIRTGSIYKNINIYGDSLLSDINDYISLSDLVFYRSNFMIWVKNVSTGVRLWELTDSSGSVAYSSIQVTGSNELTLPDSRVIDLGVDISVDTWHLISVTIDKDGYLTVYADKTKIPDTVEVTATFTEGSKEVLLSTPVPGIKEGDRVINTGSGDTRYFDIQSSTDSVITLTEDYQSDNEVVTGGAIILKRYRWSLTGTNTNYRLYMPRIDSVGLVAEVSKPRYSASQSVLNSQIINSLYDIELGELFE